MLFLSANVTMSLFNYPIALVDKHDEHVTACKVIKKSNKSEDKNKEMVVI